MNQNDIFPEINFFLDKTKLLPIKKDVIIFTIIELLILLMGYAGCWLQRFEPLLY